MSSPNPTQQHPPLVSSIVSPGLQLFLDHPSTRQSLPTQAELSDNPHPMPGQRGAAYVCDVDGSITQFDMVAKISEGRRNAIDGYFSLDPVNVVCVQ
jgi:hypothetical protein